MIKSICKCVNISVAFALILLYFNLWQKSFDTVGYICKQADKKADKLIMPNTPWAKK